MAIAIDSSISVLDHCLVTPPFFTSGAAEIHAPLTFLDMSWLHFNPIQRLVFYEIPHLPRSQFVGDIIPKLKDSLSFTLGHFPLLAGNLIIPPDVDSSSLPEICYRHGNGVAVVVAECNNDDFNHLASNDERDSAEFHPLVPELKSSLQHVDSSESLQVRATPVLALQVTFFPDVGLSIGISNHHTVGDARSIFNFMKSWAILHSKLSQDDSAGAELLVSEALPLPLPIFDKNLIKDTKGVAKIVMGQWNSIIKRQKSLVPESTTEIIKVRKTFVISAKDVEKLKNLASGEGGKLVHVSSYNVICSYVWTCLVKSRLVSHGKYTSHEDDDDENQYFVCVADCRERSDPPVPANYFGNCLMSCMIKAKSAELAGGGGFQMAAEMLGRAIHEKFMRKEAVFDGAETQLESVMNLNWNRITSVAGSPRYNFYNLDFGWGDPIKFEFISIDETGAMSLSGCRDSGGNFEVGLSLTKPQMDAFSSVFMEGFKV